MPVTVICNASTTLGCCQLPRRWAGAGAAPQIGGKLAAEPWSGCTLDASAAAAGSPVTLQVTLYLPIRAASARPCVAADTRASGRTLRACGPLGAPLGGCSSSRRAAPCPRCSRGTLPKGTPACGPRTARPASHPAYCLLAARCAPRPRHLRRRPVGLRAGLPLAQSAA